MKIKLLSRNFIKNNDKTDKNYNLWGFTTEFKAMLIFKEWDMVSCFFITGFVVRRTAQRDIDFGFYLFHPHYLMFLGGKLHFGV